MGELKMSEEGILKMMLEGSPLKGLGVSPQIFQNDIVIELTEEQLKNLLLEKADERAKRSVNIKIENGKLVLRIKLW
jgi:hypothetical protein